MDGRDELDKRKRKRGVQVGCRIVGFSQKRKKKGFGILGGLRGEFQKHIVYEENRIPTAKTNMNRSCTGLFSRDQN